MASAVKSESDKAFMGMGPRQQLKKASEFHLGCGVDRTLPIEDSRQLSQVVCHLLDDPKVITLKDMQNSVDSVRIKRHHKKIGVNLKAAVRPSMEQINVSALAGMSLEATSNHAASLKVVTECRIDLTDTEVKSTKENFESTVIHWILSRTEELSWIATRAAKECRVKPSELKLCNSDLREIMQSRAEWSLEVMSLAIDFAKLFDLDNGGKPFTEERIREKLNLGGAYSHPTPIKASEIVDEEPTNAWEVLLSLCKEYIQDNRVTDYVSGLIIGAAVDERADEALSKFRAEAVGSIESANLPVQASVQAGIHGDKESGFMETVSKGRLRKSENGYEITTPAVLEHILQPITTLVQTHELHDAMAKALEWYIHQANDWKKCKRMI